MEPISTLLTELNQRIKLLATIVRTPSGVLIKDEIDDIKENLKPINLIWNTVEEINGTIGFKSHIAH